MGPASFLVQFMEAALRKPHTEASTGPKISVAVAAGNRAARRRISTVLAEDGFALIVQASTPRGLSQRRDGRLPDVVVVNLDDPGSDGAEAARSIAELMPGARVVLVAANVDGAARRNLETLVDGLVLESRLEEALPLAVRSVCAGQVTVPRELRRPAERPVLSVREKQILGLVTLGLANAEIAGKLHLAESTVKSHLSSAFVKLGVRSRNEAAAVILDPNGQFGPGILRISDDDALVPHSV